MTDMSLTQNNGETEFQRLSRDIRTAARTLGRREARFLVDLYYQMQDYRISSQNQVRSMEDEPHDTISFFSSQNAALEAQVKSVLTSWTDSVELGKWAKGITGIGPVIAAGLLAHIDFDKAPTVGHVWRYAGLDPTSRWEKGEKRPWNASLKVICWKAGESFVKVQNNDKDIYGKVYVARKAYEIERNDRVDQLPLAIVPHISASRGDQGFITRDGEQISAFLIEGRWYIGGNAKAAQDVLARKRIGKDTDAYAAYSAGKLPPAHIHARAKRYAVKLFLAHFWETGYELHTGNKPPLPYPIEHLGHAHRIPAPPRSQAA